jgi:hypothetical protein
MSSIEYNVVAKNEKNYIYIVNGIPFGVKNMGQKVWNVFVQRTCCNFNTVSRQVCEKPL